MTVPGEPRVAVAVRAIDTGYVPMRDDALEIEPALSMYSRRSPLPGRLRPARRDARRPGARWARSSARYARCASITARAVAEIFNGGDVQSALTAAAEQSNLLIANYNARN